MLKFVLKLKNILIFLEKYVAAYSLLLLLIFTLTQIIARNFFNAGFPDLEVISRHLVLYIAFSGAALISESNKHIKIDILPVFLSPRQNKLLLHPILFISSIICASFAWYALKFWLDELSYTASQDLWIVYMAFVLPAGFSILSLHFLLLSFTGIQQNLIVTRT